MIRLLSLATVLCVIGFGHAKAATPNFDTESYCRSTIMGEGPYTQEKYDYCIRTEHSAKGMVGRARGKGSQALMDRCIVVAKTSRDGTVNQGSYGILVTCLEGREGVDGDDGQAR